MSTADTYYLEFVADQRLAQLGLPKRYGAQNPFDFMELQDVQELTNFFKETAAYQHGVEGDVAFDEDFNKTAGFTDSRCLGDSGLLTYTRSSPAR